MSNFDHYEFYKELYFKENERRTEIESSLNIPLAIITGLVAGIYILATTFPYEGNLIISIIFSILMLITFGVMGMSAHYLILAFADASSIVEIFDSDNTFSYRAIPYSQSLFNWHTNLVMFYEQNNPNNPNDPNPLSIVDIADNELKMYVISQLVDSTNHNTFVNDRKLADVFRCKKYIILALACNVVAIVPYMYAFVAKSDDVHKVELQNKSHKIEILTTSPVKSTNNMKKTHLDTIARNPKTGKYLDVETRPLRFDVTGKPCPPLGRVIKEGKYPEKPLNYKK